MKKLMVALVVTAGALSIAGGGVGIALVDSTPTFGEREFVSLEGGGLSKHLSDTITMTCTQDGVTVLHDATTAAGYGAFFQLGPNATWTGGAAVCTAQLVKYAKSGTPRVLDQFSFAAGG
ncbi:MAG: hypothetical protein ABJB55_08955 [Actinomycetota bacterium]